MIQKFKIFAQRPVLLAMFKVSISDDTQRYSFNDNSNSTRIQNLMQYIYPLKMSDCPMRRCATTPVCGSDGNTYPSKCALETVACEKKNPYLKFVYNGACEGK